MLVKEFMELAKAINDPKVNDAFNAGYIELSARYLADVYESMAHEAYAKRVYRPWHTDQPSEEIERNFWKISLRLRNACIKA